MKKQIITIKKAVLALVLFLGPNVVTAQYDALFTQYMFNETFINPAYTGSKEAMSATLLHRQQWVSFPGRPVTTSFSLHGPIQNNKMGVGLNVLTEKIGVMNRTLIYGTYAYRLKFVDKSTLSMGLMGGIENQVNRLGTLKVSNDVSAPTDPQFGNTPNVLAPNFGTGVYYNTKSLYVGLSVPRLIDNTVEFTKGGTSTIKSTKLDASKFTYYLTAGYLFDLEEDFKLRTNVMMKAVKNAPLQFDIGANLLIKDFIWAGASYRTGSAISLILGWQINKQFLFSYSYDVGVNKLQTYSSGSHEIVINYLFSFSGKKIITPRYF
jgi:type IX secretion system PorP/SprF family membrane protein